MCCHFFPRRCVSVLAAADFAALEDFGDLRVFDAAVAARLLVTFRLPAWARALPAARLDAFDAVGDRSVFDAAVAALRDVLSFLAMPRNNFLWEQPDGHLRISQAIPIG